LFHGSVRELHAAIMEGRRSRLLVRVDDAAQIVKQSLEQVNPSFAASISDDALKVAVGVSQSTPIDTVMRMSSLAGWLALPLAAGAVACFVAAVHVAADRRRAVEAVGLVMVVSGIAYFALLAVGVNLAASIGDDDRQRTALRAVFWSLTHLLNVQAKIAITIGTVLVIAGAYAGTGQIRTRLGGLVDEIGRRLGEPVWRGLACVTAIAVGYFAMRWPEATTAILVRGGAFVAFVAGGIGLLDVLGSVNWAIEGSARVQRTARRLAFGMSAVIVVFSVTLLFGGLAFARAMRAPGADRPDIQTSGCNGSLLLCDRRLDEVVFAGTHNSMAASAEEGWYVARQTGGIGAQLAAGVRAFFVDLHYGGRRGDRVRTNLSSESDAEELDELTPTERATVERLFGFLGGDETHRDVFLCHIYCELGATGAVNAFREIHDYLRENPNEVVILVLEDHVDAADAMRVLQKGGLAKQAMQWHKGEPLPTLRDMIEQRHNVVVLAENDGGTAPWYIPAYDLLQETPYRFVDEEHFSCKLNRGESSNPMFLVNHWLSVDPPKPSVAAQANAADVLLTRAERCRNERHHLPNILAVDFYAYGDLLDAVAALNGIAPITIT
jgi:hypothetical protein